MKRANQTFPIIVEKDEDGFFVATNPALVGCYSQGKTIEEALRNIRAATTLCLKSLPVGKRRVGSNDVSVHLIAA